MNRLTKVGLLVLVNLVLLLGCFFLYEIGVPLAFPHPFPATFDPNVDMGWTHEPSRTDIVEMTYRWDGRMKTVRSTVTINADGFHDPPYPLHQNASDINILFLGDSFLAALQVERSQTFSGWVERRLNEKIDRPVHLYNLGVSGWTVDNQYAAYLKYAPTLQPQMTLVVLYLDNDVMQVHYPTYRRVYKNELHKVYSLTKPHFTIQSDGELKWNPLNKTVWSFQQTQLWRTVKSLAVIDKIRNPKKKPSPVQSRFGPERSAMLLNGGFDFYVDHFVTILDWFRQEVEAQGGQFGILLIPSVTLLYPLDHPHNQDKGHNYWLDEEITQKVREGLDRAELPYVDAGPILKTLVGDGQKRQVGFKEDGHFNPEVHKALGPPLSEFIESRVRLTSSISIP